MTDKASKSTGQLLSPNHTFFVFVEGTIRFLDFEQCVTVFHLFGHNVDKLHKIDHPPYFIHDLI